MTRGINRCIPANTKAALLCTIGVILLLQFGRFGTPRKRQGCPPCDLTFSRLEQQVQIVEMQMRGEPKTGTTFMFHWSHVLLVKTCDYLNGFFGVGSCKVEESGRDDTVRSKPQTYTLVFDPGNYGRCQCDNVKRVKITVTDHHKHVLPVGGSCPWYHSNSLARGSEECMSVRGRRVENHVDLWACVEEAACKITDNRLQFVTMRDPRPVAVSTYFYLQENPGTQKGTHPALNMTVDDGVMQILPSVARYTGLRFSLFEGLMSGKSRLFWYEDALADPEAWCNRWLEFAGLRLPSSVVREASKSATGEDFGFWSPEGLNRHPGGKAPTASRSWKDEINPELLEEIDDIVRLWLPPVLLAKIGLKVLAR